MTPEPLSHHGDPEQDEAELRRQERESQEHGGQAVARQKGGLNYYASTYEKLYTLLAEQGIELDEVSIARVPEVDENLIA